MKENIRTTKEKAGNTDTVSCAATKGCFRSHGPVPVKDIPKSRQEKVRPGSSNPTGASPVCQRAWSWISTRWFMNVWPGLYR